MPFDITWDDPNHSHTPLSSHYTFPPEPHITESTPRKLRKRVSFAASVKSDVSHKSAIAISDDENDASGGESSPGKGKKKLRWKSGTKGAGGDEEVVIISQPSSSSSPGGESTTSSSPHSPKGSGWFSRLKPNRSKKASTDAYIPINSQDSIATEHDAHPILEASSNSAEPSTWHHHDRYFPVYSESDVFGSPSKAPAPQSTSNSAYTFSSPFENALTPMELQAIEHSKMSGRPVVVHYPDLPAFKDYLQGKTPEAIGWNSARWGTEGWTGYGWGGEALPDKEGKTFGAPMPEGKAIGGDKGGGGGKKEGGGGGGGGGVGGEGGGDEGKDEADGGDAGAGDGDAKEGGDGAAAPAAGAGGGGGKKKKKK